MSEHFKEICMICEKTISSCRCPSPDKTIRKIVCDKCANKALDNIEKIARGMAADYERNR